MNMEKTKRRNGVLIYIAKNDKKFAIIGDEGIDRVTPANFWEGTKSLMQGHFTNGDLVQGLEIGIAEVGKILKGHFPYEEGDENELPNEISYG
jgi:uncharacterized membrane protein